MVEEYNAIHKDFVRDICDLGCGGPIGHDFKEVIRGLYWRRDEMGSNVPEGVANSTLKLGAIVKESGLKLNYKID